MRFFNTTSADRVRTFCCSFCGKPRDKVPKMFAGYHAHICSECLTLCNEIIREDAESQLLQPELFAPPQPKTNRNLECSFCGKSEHQVQRLIAGPGVYVCHECLEICNEMLRDDALMEQINAPPHGLTHQTMPHGIHCPLCGQVVSDFTFIPHRGPLCALCLEAVKAVIEATDETV